jgi:hypothetical protein
MIILTKPDDVLYNTLQEKLEGVHSFEGYFTAICPYHQSEPVRASLFVYLDGHDFKCKSCEKYGSLEFLNATVSGTKLPTRTLDTVSSSKVPFFKWLKKYGSYEEAANVAHRTALDNPYLVDYLEKRKVGKFIEQGHFGYIDGYFSFPVYSPEGEFVDWVVRTHPRKANVDSKYAVRPHAKGEPPHLYSPSWDRVARLSEVMVPYGLLDAWTLHAAGYAVITTITGQQVNTAMFADIRKKLWIIPDTGEEKSAFKVKSELGWRGGVLLPDYPEGEKDLNGVHMKYGINKVVELIGL